MNLDQFLHVASPRDLEDYRSRYPDPALVLRVAPDSSSRASPEVLFLAKSDKNSFRNMVTLGRAPNNDVRIDHPTISKVHAVFVRASERWSVLDPGSTNGTIVNGLRVSKSTSYHLLDGAKIQLGGEIVARFFTPRGVFRLLERAALLRRVA